MKRALPILALTLAAASLPVLTTSSPAPGPQLQQLLLAVCRERGVNCSRVGLHGGAIRAVVTANEH